MFSLWLDAAPDSAPTDARCLAAAVLTGNVAVEGPGWGLTAQDGGRIGFARENGVLAIVDGTAQYDATDTAWCSPQHIAETWLRQYLGRGEGAMALPRGRYRAAIVDLLSRTVVLATDRFATLSWCYAASADRIRVSDRADTLGGTLDPQSLFSYCFFHVIPAPRTVFRDVARLPQGSLLRWEGGSLAAERHWSPVFDEPSSADFTTAKQTFIGLVRASVQREADGGNVGAFLSGGTDSSTVSGMLGMVTDRPARTYSIGFDAPGYDEMEYARIAARHFGADHHEYYVTPDDLVAEIPRVATHYDQPFGNSSAVPAYLCACRAREDGVSRLLAGDGGDELFGGNSRYAKQRVFSWYGTVPAVLQKGLMEPALLGIGLSKQIPLVKKAASYVEQARVPMPDRTQMYNMLLRLGIDEVFEPGFAGQINREEPFRAQRGTWDGTPAGRLINRMLAFDWKFTLADNDLPKVTGTTALAGVGVGFPLLSDELVDFSLRLPPEWKLKHLTLRWFFKEALRGFLPDAIITKKKHGFGLPFGLWATRHAGLRALATDSMEALKARGLVRPAFVDALMTRHLPEHPGYYGEMVWILMMLEQWLRAHAPQWKVQD